MWFRYNLIFRGWFSVSIYFLISFVLLVSEQNKKRPDGNNTFQTSVLKNDTSFLIQNQYIYAYYAYTLKRSATASFQFLVFSFEIENDLSEN